MQGKIPSAITRIMLDRATFSEVPIDELTFVNFFYGNNGTGKSTIARAIMENDGIVWGTGESPDDYDVLVYNREFINDNFANYGSLKGVYIFGKEDIKAKETIKEYNEEKKEKDTEHKKALERISTIGVEQQLALETFQNNCFAKSASIRQRFGKAMEGKKQKRTLSEAILGVKEPFSHDLGELERLYDSAYDEGAQIYPEFSKISSNAVYGNLPGRELLDKEVVSSSDTSFARFLKALGNAATDWVRTGHTHFSAAADGKCPYCQQKLPDNFEEDIAATFDAQYQEDILNLSQFQQAYCSETAKIVDTLKSNLLNCMPSLDVSAYKEKLALLESNFEINRQRLIDKTKEPSKVISLEDTDTILLEIGSMIDDINEIIRANNAVVAQVQTSRERCKENVLQYLAMLLSPEVRTYRERQIQLEQDYSETKSRAKKLEGEIGALKTEIAKLNTLNVSTETAVQSINKILKESGFQGFSIRAKSGENNVYEIVREDGTIANNLSEGERNFIAFLYFYHLVRGSMSDEELKDKIVVIDDPVSSMDSSALFLVGAIVREMISICENNVEYENPKVQGDYIKQLFILTHNVYFHREITYKQVGCYNCASFYLIRKNDNNSKVKLCKRKKAEIPTEEENYNPVKNSYAALWDELRETQSTIPTLNVMRQILEYYFLQLCGYEGGDLRSVVLDDPANRQMFIKQVPGKQPDMTDYHMASSLLAFINNPNGISDGLNYVEDFDDVESYKRVFKMIFEVLKQDQHYKMMTGTRS